MPQSKSYKYAVGGIGIGRAGTGRTRTYETHGPCEVVAVADSDAANLELAKKRFEAPGYLTAAEMFKNHKIDIAVASLPVRANYEVVMAAVKGGVKALVTEKPFTAKLSDADDMVAVCKAKGIPLASGLVSMNRWNHWKAKEMLHAGEIGEIVRINIYDENHQGGCHGPNLARHFAGAEVDFVSGYATGDPFNDYEDQDPQGRPGFGGVGGFIKFKNGVECFSTTRRADWRAFEVIGTKGMIYKDGGVASRELYMLKSGKDKPTSFSDLLPVPDMNELLIEREDEDGVMKYGDDGWALPTDGMIHSTRAIVAALDTGKPVQLTTGEDLRQALEICIGWRESARRGNTILKFPIADRSLTMYPQRSRWNYKKELMGHDAYMKALSKQVK